MSKARFGWSKAAGRGGRLISSDLNETDDLQWVTDVESGQDCGFEACHLRR